MARSRSATGAQFKGDTVVAWKPDVSGPDDCTHSPFFPLARPVAEGKGMLFTCLRTRFDSAMSCAQKRSEILRAGKGNIAFLPQMGIVPFYSSRDSGRWQSARRNRARRTQVQIEAQQPRPGTYLPLLLTLGIGRRLG